MGHNLGGTAFTSVYRDPFSLINNYCIYPGMHELFCRSSVLSKKFCIIRPAVASRNSALNDPCGYPGIFWSRPMENGLKFAWSSDGAQSDRNGAGICVEVYGVKLPGAANPCPCSMFVSFSSVCSLKTKYPYQEPFEGHLLPGEPYHVKIPDYQDSRPHAEYGTSSPAQAHSQAHRCSMSPGQK